MVDEGMLFWLAQVCRELRTDAGRKQVHVAAGADVDQSTVNRFERSIAWPRHCDRLVRAYADDLGVDPISLWTVALDRWRAHETGRR